MSGFEGVELVYRLFSENRLTKSEALDLIDRMKGGGGAAPVLHPLLHENTSTLTEQRFTSSFSGSEFYFKDHTVQGRRVMPGVALVEMALAAVERSADFAETEKRAIRLRNIMWVRPLSAPEEGPLQVHVSLSRDKSGEVRFEIFSDAPGDSREAAVYCQGSARFVPLAERTKLDVARVRNALGANCIDARECYEAFEGAGVEYGPALRGIETIFHDSEQVLAKLRLPAAGADCAMTTAFEAFTLHPALLDAALQACIGLSRGDSRSPLPSRGLLLPFALEECEVLGACTPNMWSSIRRSPGSTASDRVQKVDIDLCAADGKVCVRLRGLSSRESVSTDELVSEVQTVIARPVWRNSARSANAGPRAHQRHVVMCCNAANLILSDLQAAFQSAHCTSIESGADEASVRFEEVAVRAFEAIREIIAARFEGTTLVQILISMQGEGHLYSGLAGLVRTARLEQPRVLAQLIEVDPKAGTETMRSALREGILRPEESHIRLEAGHCLVRAWQEAPPLAGRAMTPWKDRGVYLLTGGATGLGLVFAREIAAKASGVVLFLVGRSVPREEQRKAMNDLENLGATVGYRQVDVSDQPAVDALVAEVVSQYGCISGVIHGAGIIQDEFLLRKTTRSFREVLAPKVAGTVNLDRATRNLPLDLFVLFSSGAAVFGNAGQADYATANAFMNAYAAHRNDLVASGDRRGSTVSICWPLWADGGMQPGDVSKESLAKSGIVALQTPDGIDALYRCLASGQAQPLVVRGGLQRVRELLIRDGREPLSNRATPASVTRSVDRNPSAISEDALATQTERYLKQLVSETLKLPPDRVEPDTPLDHYGIDSIAVMRLTNTLEETFGSLSKTLFFEYRTLRELSVYFIASHTPKLREFLRADQPPGRDSLARGPALRDGSSSARSHSVRPAEAVPEPAHSSLDIAIIGLSGRYAASRDLGEFWKNLRAGKDCITEIPPSRWDWREYYTEERSEGGHHSKWGGFIEDVDKFDPLFFGISPREAEFLDPQERLFLEHAWMALEDAGYRRADLQKGTDDDLPAQVGVYAGVMFGEYQLFGVQAGAAAATPLSSSYASIANRVSYVLNLHGPSLTVDTMCSSSLTSLYLACQDLKLGRTDLALAGGVNVSIHPNKYSLLSGGRFLSTTGHCASFGQGGDGYVPGEGVGVAVLKRLADAERDGDRIYGVILGAAINHGGRTNAYSVPNPNAQRTVISRALREASVQPHEVTYVEAHGTGTELGDPIEVTGLTRVFGGRERRVCWLGSAKSNIGHCESAAGIAGVTKVLLQMKHGEIAPSLHSRALNPNIDFDATPFVVNQELREWNRPAAGRRIAGVSSFGAGGSNAHLVIAEYLDPKAREIRVLERGPYAVLLSAKTEERLREYAANVLSFIQGFSREGANPSPDRQESRPKRAELESLVLNCLANILCVEAEEIDLDQTLQELGGDAFQARRLFEALQSEFAIDPDRLSLIPRPSVALIVDALMQTDRASEGDTCGSPAGLCEPALALRDLAYTLQVGREDMDERLALLAGSINELEVKFAAYLSVRQVGRGPGLGQGYDSRALDDVYRGHARHHRETLAHLDKDEDMALTVDAWLEKRKYDKLLSLWVNGLQIDWRKLYAGDMPRRISLPTYPFARERYWVPKREKESANSSDAGLAQSIQTADIGNLLFVPAWRDGEVANVSRRYSRRLVVMCGLDSSSPAAPAGKDESFSRIRLTPAGGGLSERYQAAALQLLGIVRGLLEEKISGEVLLQLVIPADNEGALFAGLLGMLRTAHLENPRFFGQLVEVDLSVTDGDLANLLEEYSRQPRDTHVRYLAGRREVRDWQEAPESPDKDLPVWRDSGVYLITGGAGGLGLIFAQEISEEIAAPTLILTGRSTLTTEKEGRLSHLRSLGARVVYRQVDVSRRDAVEDLIQGIKDEFGGLTGVIHCAGVIRDSFILKKADAEAVAVLAAKIAATVHLDQACASQPLDFIIFFSSVVGSLGNVGQADYAAGNAFMDAYAGYRNRLVASGQRFGRTLSISWPLWESGGMRVDPAFIPREGSDESTRAMPTSLGIRSFYVSFQCGFSHVLVMHGRRPEMRRRLFEAIAVPERSAVAQHGRPGDAADIKVHLIDKLKTLLGEVARIPAGRIDIEEPLDSYGIDSVMITRMNQRLESVFPEIPKTLFFQYRTLSGVAGYLESEYPSECRAWLKAEIPVSAPARSESEPRPRPISCNDREPIAIVGISGRYPEADTLDVFWENLKAGRDCVTEIPGERWPIDGFYEPDADKAREQGKSYSKWGGFLRGFAEFDPLFFGISPREALSIDPQERLFLQTCWEALENAGYTRASLRDDYRQRVGIFVGITKTGFDLYGPELRARGHVSHLHTSFSSAANRVSYVLDVRGPSMPVDTMCSASLTAIHEACEHLRSQECEMAIAGGVNLYLHPSTYYSLSALGALSASGKCRSFGQAGDGFVPGEGVGAVVLKRLSRALADRDTIHALIRATGVNHNGRTNGYTVPNPNAQSELIRAVLDRAGVSAREVTCVEAHGTGTTLGDPIEIAGLAQAYGEDTDATGFCALGSVKSNVGHLEAAAGMAALTKVVLQIKHGQLAPTLHTAEPNPNINFARTPFVLQRELAEWRRPMVENDGGGLTERPRLAGISSFGAGGANAHILVEEYVEDGSARHAAASCAENHAFIVSARNDMRLQEAIDNLRQFLARAPSVSPCDLAFTLQVGREAMDVRLGTVAATIAELADKLAATANAGNSVEGVFQEGVFQGRVPANPERAPLAEDLAIALSNRQYGQVLTAWVQGHSVEWTRLYSSAGRALGDHRCEPRRIGLPTYPFARERYWVAEYGLAAKRPGLTADPLLKSPRSSRLKPTGITLPDVQSVGRLLAEEGPIETLVVPTEEKEFVEFLDRGAGVVELKISTPDGLRSSADVFDAITRSFEGLRNRSEVCVMLVSGLENLNGKFDGSIEPIRQFQDIDASTIAILKGDGLGVGWLLAISCDFMICSRHGRYGFRGNGISPAWSAAPEVRELVERHFGQRGSRGLLSADRAQTGQELHEQGLGMPVLDPSEVEACAMALATDLAGLPRLSLLELKRHLCRAPLCPEEAFHWLALNESAQPPLASATPRQIALSSSTVSALAYPDGALLVTLRDEAHKNMYSADLCRGIAEVFAHIRETPNYKVVVITGYGHYFACGGTRDGVLGMQAGVTKYSDVPLYELPLCCEIPVLAAMQGHAIGAGWAFGMFCDAAIFGAESIYTSRFMKLGFTPGFGSTLVFPYCLGCGLAREILFTARDYQGADLAVRTPAVSVFPRAAVLDEALKAAHRIALSPRQELMRLKAHHSRALRQSLSETIDRELAMHERTFVGNETALSRIEREFSSLDALGFAAGIPVAGKAAEVGTAAFDSIVATLRETLAEQVLVSPDAVDVDRKFSDLGLDSIIGVIWVKKLNAHFGLSMSATIFYKYPTVFELAAHVRSLEPVVGVSKVEEPVAPSALSIEGKDSSAPARNGQSIAIIGMSGRFPMARTLDDFWKNLQEGKDCITEVPESRWSIADFYDPDRSAPGKTDCKWMGVLEGAAEFDPLFFNISPRDAVMMDPQQRLFLEACWHCIEDAGCAPDSLSGSRCGVFVGCAPSDYGQWAEDRGLNAQRLMGGATSILGARVSYALNLQGPCLSIDTACSSSLVAIANACDSLILRHSDLALAGGVCVLAGPSLHIMASKAGMLSKDGRCFTFDQRANGFVPGEGVGVVLLKRLADAVADRDPICGVIRGWGVNQDGKTNGITAPNPLAQTRLEEEVYRRFDIEPAGIQLVEAHGTGTKLGDPIEVDALCDAFRTFTTKTRFCALGSVKSNIGHLIAAAGVSGVIKVLLALRRRQLPPTANYRNLNEHIALADTPFYVNTACRDWEAEGGPRLAAISSFGFSGTNAHVVIEEYVLEAAVPSPAPGPVMIVLSAKKEDRLRAYAESLLRFARGRIPAAGASANIDLADIDLADIGYTLQVGRTAMSKRLGFVVSSFGQLEDRLQEYLDGAPSSEIYRGDAKLAPRAQIHSPEPIAAGEYGKVVERWVQGEPVDWKALHRGEKRSRVTIPGYPFAAEEYWMPGSNKPPERATSPYAWSARTGAKRPKRVCVVGAGPAGLVMAKALLEEGHEPVVYEKQDRPGGLWNLTRDKAAGAYRKTRFQTSRYTSLFSDFSTGAIDSHFYGVDDMKRYLDLYAKKFQLDSAIACNTEVLSVEELTGEWRVRSRANGQDRSESFDGVAMCQGIYWTPRTPSIPGIERFRGEVLHSAQYYDDAVFRNKRVLIVGNGISGMDLAEEASRRAREVVWNMRSLKLIMPRMTGFVPNDFQSPARLLADRRMTEVAERLKFSMPDYYALYRRSGLLPGNADIERHPVVCINDEIVRLVAEGRVRTVIGTVREITEDGCRFSGPPHSMDGIDLIAFCTGYETGSSFGYIGNIEPKRDFAMGIFFAKNPTLVNTSSLLPVGFSGSFFFPEMVSRWYAKLLSGALELTDRELRHRVTDDYAAVMGPLSSVMFGLRLGLLPKPEHAFSEFWRLLNLPPLSAIYRAGGLDSSTADPALQRLLKTAVMKNGRNDSDLQPVKWRILAGLGRPAVEALLKRGEIEPSDLDGALGCLHNPIVFNWDLQYMKRDRIPPQVAESSGDDAFYSSLARMLKSSELEADGLVAALGEGRR